MEEQRRRVKVQAYGGAVLTRILITDGGDTVYVSREEEYEAARKEGREPKCVGFNRQFVLGYLPTGE